MKYRPIIAVGFWDLRSNEHPLVILPRGMRSNYPTLMANFTIQPCEQRYVGPLRGASRDADLFSEKLRLNHLEDRVKCGIRVHRFRHRLERHQRRIEKYGSRERDACDPHHGERYLQPDQIAQRAAE